MIGIIFIKKIKIIEEIDSINFNVSGKDNFNIVNLFSLIYKTATISF